MIDLEHLWQGNEVLSPAEKRCLTAAAAGLRRRESGVVLGLSPHTVDRQLTTARRRLRAKNTTHAVASAIRQGLIP
jgi:DNA-binding CsgD family transcriptional regulator